MGGAAGHVMAPFEDLTLSFGELKRIFKDAANANLKNVTEKLDGQNIIFTWNRGLRFARNKSDLLQGGMNMTSVAERFKGRGGIENAFNSAFCILNIAIRALDSQTKSAVFNFGKIWYSAEILFPETFNVIKYDKPSIVLHQQVDNLNQNFTTLIKKIALMQSAINCQGWLISGPAYITMRKLKDASIASNACKKISILETNMGMKDSDTLGGYIHNIMIREIIAAFPNLRKWRLTALATRMAGLGGLTTSQIAKGLPAHERKSVMTFAHRGKALARAAIYPIEIIVHKFAIELLRGYTSAFINDNNYEIMRLQNHVTKVIHDIKISGNAKALDILQTNLKKLDQITTSIEGIVFCVNDRVYKFTSNFAPMNQIIGIQRYGRV